MPLRPLAIFGSPQAESLLRSSGLGTLDAIFQRRGAAHLRHVGRAVWRTELAQADGKTMTVFIKLSWGRRRWWPRLPDMRAGQVFKSLATREWEGLDVFTRLGLNVPERLAMFEEGLLWKRSALVLKAVPPAASLSDMILDGGWLRLSASDRRRILESCARTLWRIHSSGWAWRSISTRHVFPERNSAGDWGLWLIDCEGVHRPGSRAFLDRDFRRFLRALEHDRADERTVEMMRETISQLPPLAAIEAPIGREQPDKIAA
jgi:Lipopolysaccharide kinase (Kdo/WaaP) family